MAETPFGGVWVSADPRDEDITFRHSADNTGTHISTDTGTACGTLDGAAILARLDERGDMPELAAATTPLALEAGA